MHQNEPGKESDSKDNGIGISDSCRGYTKTPSVRVTSCCPRGRTQGAGRRLLSQTRRKRGCSGASTKTADITVVDTLLLSKMDDE